MRARSFDRARAGWRLAAAMAALLAAPVVLAVPLAAPAVPDGPLAARVNLSQTAGPSSHPVVAVSAETTLVVWEEGDALWYAVRRAGPWSAAAPVPAAFGSTPTIAVGPGGRFELAWSGFDDVEGNFEIYYSRFVSGTWELPEVVSSTAGDSILPEIAVTGDGARLIVWAEVGAGATLLYAGLASGNDPWSYGPVPNGEGGSPSVVASGRAWHFAWVSDADGDGDGDVMYMRRDAMVWGLPEVLSDMDAAVADPTLAIDPSGLPAVAWLAGQGAVWYTAGSDAGWSVPARVDGDAGASGGPALAMDAAGAHLAWSRDAEVLVAHGVDNVWPAAGVGMSFGDRARGAALVTYPGRLGLAAEGRSVGAAGDIFYVEVDRADAPSATPPIVTPGTPGTPGTPDPTATVRPSETPAARFLIHLPRADKGQG